MQIAKMVLLFMGMITLRGFADDTESFNRLSVANADGVEIAAIEKRSDHFRLVTCQVTDDDDKVHLGTLADCANRRKNDPRCVEKLSAPLSEAELDFLMRLPLIQAARSEITRLKVKGTAPADWRDSLASKQSSLQSLSRTLERLNRNYDNETCSIARSGIYRDIRSYGRDQSTLQESVRELKAKIEAAEVIPVIDVRPYAEKIEEQSCDLLSLLMQLNVRSVSRKDDSVDGAKLLAMFQRLVEKRDELDVFQSRDSYPLSVYRAGDKMYEGYSASLRTTVYERTKEDYARVTGKEASTASLIDPGFVRVTCGSNTQVGVSTSHALWLLGKKCSSGSRVESVFIGNGVADLK